MEEEKGRERGAADGGERRQQRRKVKIDLGGDADEDLARDHQQEIRSSRHRASARVFLSYPRTY